MLLIWGRDRGLVTHNFRTWLYQSCANQLVVIRTASTSSVLTFHRTFPIIKKEKKHLVARNLSNSLGMHLLLSYVDLHPPQVRWYLMACSWCKKMQLWESPFYTNFSLQTCSSSFCHNFPSLLTLLPFFFKKSCKVKNKHIRMLYVAQRKVLI